MKLVRTTSLNLVKTVATVWLVLVAIALNSKQSLAAAPPPVFWNVFTGEVIKGKVVLKWVVTEYNNRMFYIEHSTNGNEWKTVDSVNTKNSPLTLDDYAYTHDNKLEGRQYYRIRQVDLEAANSGYSKVVSLILTHSQTDAQASPISLTPNPATDMVRIINETGSIRQFVKAMIYDLGGKLVAEKNIEKHSNIVSIKDLPAGIYMMRAQGENGNFFAQKIIKQ